MSKVYDDLMAAFAGESQANRKYLAYAKKAETEGHPQVAKLFRAVAHAETIHALNHFERAGDRIVNICERIAFTATGELRDLD